MKYFQAIDLWQHINHKFGLHLRNEEGRDNQLYNKLKENLCCPKEIGIKKYLEHNPQITALRFIQAFLCVTEPFSNMYKNIYSIMKEYSMKEGHESVRIRCQLENEQLEFNLEHFKELIRVESLVRKLTQQRVWLPEYVNEIPYFFRVLTDYSITVNHQLELTDVLEPPPTYSHPRLNECLFEVYNLLLNIKNQQPRDSNWYGSYGLAKPFYDEFVSNGSPINVEKAIDTYESIFSRLENRQVEVEVLIEKFEEYLNLPFWKNRWYVYEVWITLQTVISLKNYNIKLNIGSEGILPLSSGRYSHVGTFMDKKKKMYTLHAQLQTTVEGFENRKAMEPDLRIMEGNFLESEFTRIIIECKQRIEMNREQLEKNIGLYEYGARSSQNIFVNYDLFPEIQKSKFNRTELLSNVRPNNTDEFYKVLNKLLLNANIIPQKNESNYCALLLDSSGSMDSYLTSEVKDKLLTILENIEVEKYFYFNSNLIETIWDTPKSLLDNLVPNCGTNLNHTLNTLVKEYRDIKSILVITDQNLIPYSSEAGKHFNKIEELNITEINEWSLS